MGCARLVAAAPENGRSLTATQLQSLVILIPQSQEKNLSHCSLITWEKRQRPFDQLRVTHREILVVSRCAQCRLTNELDIDGAVPPD